MSFQNVGFSSTTICALSGVYTDTYDDGVVLHCFTFLDLYDCTHTVLYYACTSVTCFIYLFIYCLPEIINVTITCKQA